MNTPRPLALVTGASSGIGTELALELAQAGHDLVLTGRDTPRLEAVAARVRALGAQADTLVLDLGVPGAVEALVSHLGARALAVLVNNAGFGDSSPVVTASPETLGAMITLNVSVLTLLTRALLPGMVERKAGRILNVASTGSFSPVPTMAVYGATKAYVLSFSEALAEELRGTGVTVTALCPGATVTRFADRAAVGKSAAFRGAMDAPTVAKLGVKALFAGRRVKVTGAQNALMAFSVRLSPRWLVTRIAKALMAPGDRA